MAWKVWTLLENRFLCLPPKIRIFGRSQISNSTPHEDVCIVAVAGEGTRVGKRVGRDVVKIRGRHQPHVERTARNRQDQEDRPIFCEFRHLRIQLMRFYLYFSKICLNFFFFLTTIIFNFPRSFEPLSDLPPSVLQAARADAFGDRRRPISVRFPRKVQGLWRIG